MCEQSEKMTSLIEWQNLLEFPNSILSESSWNQKQIAYG